MIPHKPLERIKTGVRNFDEILMGGIPKRSLVVIAGSPGSGKTILSQQIGFYNATESSPVIFFQTLSEPTAKSLSFVSQFDFFNPNMIGKSVHFIDLGDIMRTKGLSQAIDMMVKHLKKIKPALVVIDSFKAFEDLAKSPEELRKFSYEVAVKLIAWECTSLLLGEFSKSHLETSPLFSVVDGILMVSQRHESGEQQRYLQVLKMRGTAHDRDEHPLAISEHGVDVYAPRVTIKRNEERSLEQKWLKTGVEALDHLIPEGFPLGSSCLISGETGTGKSLLALEFLYRGATLFNEKGILFLFEETKTRVLEHALKMGWNFSNLINKGLIEIVFIPQPSIQVERDLLQMHERIVKSEAKRVVIDSSSIFLHKINDARQVREKIYQLASIIQNMNAVGFFISDVPSGTKQLSRYSVEESVTDGVILLSSEKVGQARDRYLEVYKLRNNHHRTGTHKFEISEKGMTLAP